MNVLANIGRYLWGFFVGDSFQFIALIIAFVIVGLLARPLGAVDGVVAFAAVAAIVSVDAWRRARPPRA